jgi:hypothetical protein
VEERRPCVTVVVVDTPKEKRNEFPSLEYIEAWGFAFICV